jgi:hypothetical protein
MNFFLVLVVIGAAVLLLLALKVVVALLPTTLALVFWILPLVLAIAGLVSCITSPKPSSLKLLWILIILLAPLLGPLLWFFWGKQHT